MNMKGCGATEESNGINTTISQFAACKINIEMIVGDNKFEAVRK